MRTFEIEYDLMPLASVEVDEPTADSVIQEMVEFWSNWEDHLDDNDGDYLKAWLKNLGMFILRFHRAPKAGEDEGWAPLDGSMGIRLLSCTPWEPDADCLSIK